ncbi:fimbrial protein [Acinetobacter sp. 'aerobic (ED)']|uniref:fimbrial protein n=1 Tax=Acinetobacter sp. 'aerobic (ED)' TaxID=174230 RepID=UPI00192B635C|nr:fimbrial protein [Acinetobacter sp. 'aerobic (ED)']
MKKLNLGLAVLTLGAVSTVFAAPTGTINFTGTLVDGTCDATIGSTSSVNGDFILPTVNIASLAAANETYGDTPFIIKLSGAGCKTTGGTVKIATPYFEADPTKVNAAGRLINTASSDKADKVEIQLVTSTKDVIDLNEAPVTQKTTTGIDLGSNVTDFKYFARYFATDTAAKGNVEGSVTYSILYK